MKSFLRKNGLSIVFLMLFLFSLVGQFFAGYEQYKDELIEKGVKVISKSQYFSSGHFLQATFENWESEFLQMWLFVLFTIYLRQKGSSESKSMDQKEEVDREPSKRRKDVPWPVRKGGILLKIYQNSLSLTFALLFFLSFAVHFYGSLKDQNLQNIADNKPVETAGEFFFTSRFWFESLQNWQSEFLSVFAIVIFTIYLRQKGSPQSKPVDAPHEQTGE